MMDEILNWCSDNGKCVGVFVYPDGARKVQITNGEPCEGRRYIGWEKNSPIIVADGQTLVEAWKSFLIILNGKV